MDYTAEINNLVKDKNNGNKNEPYNKWLFYPNDWVIQCILSKNEVIFDLFSLRNYNARDIDVILVKLLPDIENKRRELELTEVSFQNKKPEIPFIYAESGFLVFKYTIFLIPLQHHIQNFCQGLHGI